MLGDASGCGGAVSLVNEARGGLVSPESSPEHHRTVAVCGAIGPAWGQRVGVVWGKRERGGWRFKVLDRGELWWLR